MYLPVNVKVDGGLGQCHSSLESRVVDSQWREMSNRNPVWERCSVAKRGLGQGGWAEQNNSRALALVAQPFCPAQPCRVFIHLFVLSLLRTGCFLGA